MSDAELQRRLRDVRDEATGLRATLAERDAEIARLRALLAGRDQFIVHAGLWDDFAASLSPERINSDALSDLIAGDADLYDKG